METPGVSQLSNAQMDAPFVSTEFFAMPLAQRNFVTENPGSTREVD